MNGVAAFFDNKVVHQRAAGSHGLSANAGAAWNKIAFANFRHKLLQRAHESRLVEGAVKLAESGLPILSRHRPEALERSGLPKISEIDLGVMIALTGESKNRVGSGTG